MLITERLETLSGSFTGNKVLYITICINIIPIAISYYVFAKVYLLVVAIGYATCCTRLSRILIQMEASMSLNLNVYPTMTPAQRKGILKDDFIKLLDTLHYYQKIRLKFKKRFDLEIHRGKDSSIHEGMKAEPT